MRGIYRVMAGRGSVHAEACRQGGFIGTDIDIHQDLTGRLPEHWREFNREFVSVFQANVPGKSKIAAGLACGNLWVVSKGIADGDLVLTPDGSGSYMVGTARGEYYYVPGEILPHRRRVEWSSKKIARSDMSTALRNSTGSVGTVSRITGYTAEIDALLDGGLAPALVASDPDVEDALAFAMEKHLEDFLVANWSSTLLASEWEIFTEDGEVIGQQYATDAGIIDILARSKDGTRLLVIELKRGRISDVVVGQILRYIGYIKEQVAETGQTVEGAVIALEDDQKLRWALSAVPGVSFYRYQVSFKLHRGD